MHNAMRRAFVLTSLMLLAAGGAYSMMPTQRISDTRGTLQLDQIIPDRFGEWVHDKRAAAAVVNPQQAAMLQTLYSDTLSRTYMNPQGDRIMLMIAYGEDQRDAMQVHYPEVCYPAQGFEVKSNRKGVLPVMQTQIPVRRLETVLTGQRFEPVTYWVMIGDKAVPSGMDKKVAEMRYGLRGQIPDGLLFRVSSISRESERAFGVHERFVSDLLGALPAPVRTRLSGIGT